MRRSRITAHDASWDAYFLGLGLLLGSWYAVGIGIVIIALFGLRAVWEEETLARELDGYAAYAGRVRYRLIPGVW